MTKSMNRRLSQSSLKNANHKARDLRMESLEERQLLSVSPASAASDDVDYACIAPAEMTPLESAPVVEMNLTDQVPTLDAPVALEAEGETVDYCGYTFTYNSNDASVTKSETTNDITISGNVTIAEDENVTTDKEAVAITCDGTLNVNTSLAVNSTIKKGSGNLAANISGYTFTPADTTTTITATTEGLSTSGTVTITDNASAADQAVAITGSGTLNVETSLLTGSSVTMTSGTLSVDENCTIPTVNSDGITIEGAGDIGALNLNDGTTTVNSIGTITSATGDNNLTVKGGTVTGVESNGTVSVSDSGTIDSYTSTNGGSLSVGSDCTVADVYSSGASISGAGAVTNLHLNGGTTNVSVASVGTAGGSYAINITDGTVGSITSSSAITCSGGSITTAATSGDVTISDTGTITTLNMTTGTLTVNKVCDTMTVNSSGITIEGTGTVKEVVLANGTTTKVNSGTVTTASGSGAITITDGTIGAVTGASPVTVDGGTINSLNGSGAVVINGTTGNDTFTVGQTVTVGTTSVTFDTGCSSNVTINGGAGNDTFNVTAAPTSGSLTLNGGAGTDTLSNNTNVTLASTGIEITSTASGTVVIVTAASETADTDETTSLSEAFAALNAGTLAGDYTLGFTNASYTLDQALTSNYTNTGHKLTIDGTKVYNGVTGAAGSTGTVTVTVGNFTNTDANMTFAAGTTVVIDGLVYTGVTLEENETAKNTGVGIYNNGTLTLTGGAKVSNFNNTGIVNNSSNTLIIDDGSVISGNTGHGIQNTSTGTLYVIKGSIIQNGGDGIYNEGTVVIGKDDGSGAVDEVLIQENKKGGIDNHSATGNLTVYNGTIKSNISDNIHEQDYGINNYNGGTATLAGASAASILIEDNGTAAQELIAENKGGVRNDVGSTLTVTGATIKINHGDGIFNEGRAIIGKADGTGKASDIQILSNKSDGIENKEGSAELWIYNATISGQESEGEYGLYNHSTAKAHLYGHLETVDGEQVPSIIISSHHIGGIVNGFIGEGGIVVDDDDNPSVIDITCVKITDNYRDGIKNAGTMTVGTTASTNTAQHIQIVSNKGDAIENDGLLTVYKGTFSNNSGGASGTEFTDNGIRNYNKGTTIIGNPDGTGSNEDIVISGNAQRGIGNEEGTVTIYNADISGNRYGVENRLRIQDGSAEVTIYRANIHENTVGGVRNAYDKVTGTSVTTIGTQRTGVASDVLIVNNNNPNNPNTNAEGIAIQGGSVTVYNATISGNSGRGIYNAMNNIASTLTIDGNTTDAILIRNNTLQGIVNTKDGTLDVYKATINGNKKDGIENSGKATIGQSGNPATDILIYGNTNSGIDNTGANADLMVYNAKIYDQVADAGIYNRTGAKAVLNGSTYDAIDLSGNRYGVNNNGAGSDVTIYKAYIHDNLVTNNGAGIKNQGGNMQIGTENTGVASEVQIVDNDGHGIYTEGSGGEITIYNADISNNDQFGIFMKSSNTLKLNGNTTADLNISDNGWSGVNSENNGTVIVTKATIDNNGGKSSNGGDGINNRYGTLIVGDTEGSTSDVLITNNKRHGIQNGQNQDKPSTLTVYKATIDNSTLDGIYNVSTAKIGVGNTGSAADIIITNNKSDGIENTGTKGSLEVYNATISGNTDYGINNHNKGTATLEGSGAGTGSTIQITNNPTGVLNKDSGSTLTITGATITGNTNIGIDNQNGVAKLKGSGTGTSSSVQVTGQPLGIYNTGAASNLEISGVYITTNTTNGVGIQNHGGNATLEGATAAAVQVTGSKTGILNEYVNANQKGNLTITGAKIFENTDWGIDNQGGSVEIDGESASAVLVNSNTAGGIRNANVTGSTGNLSANGVTIQLNGGDGIYNEGIAKIGTQGEHGKGEVLIDQNTGDGIENTGAKADLTVYNATISTNGKTENAYDYGIYNVNGAKALLEGNTTDAIYINDNGRSDDDTLSGGIYNGTGSEFTIRKATITENHHHGIENDGTMVIGTQGNGHGKDEVLITSNKGDGIENNGPSGDLTVYNATISNNANSEVDGFLDHGIDNHDGGKALLDGNTAAAIYISGNGRNDIDPKSGGIYNGANSEFTIIKATVTENHHHGIDNDGTMTIGTEPASGSTTVGAASDVQVTKNKGNGIDNDDNGTLRIYNGNISQNDVGSHTESNININNGIRNDGTVVIGVAGSTDAGAVTINENRGNGILNRSIGSITVYNATISKNTNDIHKLGNPNNNGIRNEGRMKLKGTLGKDGMQSIRITRNGEDGIFNAANLSAEGYEVENIYVARNGSDGIEQGGITASTPYMTILSGVIYLNGYGSSAGKNGFGIHVKGGTMNLYGDETDSIIVEENSQSGIRVENNGSVLNVRKATINNNGQNHNGDGIHASHASVITVGTPGGAAGDVLITNNLRGGIQVASANTVLKVYNATISGNKDESAEAIAGVLHHGIHNNGKTTLEGTGSGDSASIQILSNGQHGIYNSTTGVVDKAQGLNIVGNGSRGIMNENSFTQTGAIDVVNNVGGGIDNTATGTYIQNAGTTLNVLNNKGAEDGGVYQGVDDDGAGIKNTGTLTLNGTVTITGNVGIRNGGGLYQGGTLTNDLNETLTIQDNEAVNGGGVYVAANTVINNGTTESISGNTATADGGGIYVEAGKTLSTAGESNVKSNNAVNGAGIYNAGTLTFDDKVTIDGNTATGNGGGIYQGGVITNDLNEELFVTNNTAGNGGGVYVAAATTLKNGTTNTITGNSATNGGGIYVEAGKTLTFETSNITGNTGTNGGGMYLAGTLANSDGTAELTFENNDTTAETLGNGGGLYIASGATYGPTNGTFTLNRQEDFHFINNGHYTSETDATRGGAIYNAGKLQVANTNYGFGVTVTGDPNGVKTMTPNNEINTGIGAAVYNAGTFTNASEYKAFHAGGIDDDGTVDKSTHKTYSFYVTGQAGESAFASSGSTTLSNAKIYGNSAGGLRVDDGLTTLTQGTEIGSGAFILATTSYANYAGGFGKNTGYGVKVTGGSLQSTEAQTYAEYTNKRKNTGVADSARYEDYKVADAVQISGNGGTAIIVEGTGKVFLNDMRAESNGAAGLNAAATAGGYITNAVIEGTIDRGGVTLVNTTIPKVTETDTTNNIAGENASGNRFVVDELGNTYTLNSDFDAIDKGTNNNAKYHFADGTTRTIKHDLGGHDRILNGTVDLGAFECPISWITNTMFIDDIKYAVEHCAPVAFGGKVKFDINCNGKVFYWDEDPRALNPPSVHNVAPIITYVDKDTILDARYEDADGNYYWMDIVMDFGNYSTGFGIYYSDVTFNVYGLTVVATNGGTSKNGSAFYVPELRKGGSVVNLYGVSCYDCTAAYGGAIYGETNAVINVYTDVTAAGYVKGSSTTYVVGGKTHYQPANNQAKVSQADTYRACVFEGNTGTYGGVIYSNNKRASTVIGGVEYTTGLNLVGVDLQGKTYISTGRVAHSEVTPLDKLQYDLTTEERGEGTDAVRQYSAQFINNQASRRGGAINLVGKGNVEGVSFIDNYTGYGNSPLGGGAIYVEGNGNMSLKNADFIENSSKVDGGAMVVRGKLTSDGNLVFAGNSAPYIEHGTSGTRDGGAIYCYGGNMNLKADVVTKTRALFKDQKLTTVGGYGSEFLNNEANFGGAVEIQSGTLNFTKALFQRNKASVGGALYNETPFANVTVDAGTRFLQNYASYFAGAVYNNAGSFTSAAEYKNNWAANEGALYSVYEEGIDLGKLSNNYAIGDNTQYLYYNYWMDSYDGQEARQKVGKKMPVEVKYFGVAGLNTATESSLEPASAGFAGITSSPNSTQALGSVSEWNNIYAVVTLKESTVAGETMVQELDIDTNVFQVGALSVAEGWEGEVSVTDDAKVILTLTATSDCENVGENIASLKVLAPEEGLAQDTSVMGVEVTKMSCYDIVKDNRIDIQDLVAFARNFGSDNSIADFNDDARVDIQDLVAFARNFGKVNEVSDAEPLALAAKPEDIPQTIASQPVIPAQGALLETVEEKEESNAAALAAALPPVESQTQACDFIFANDDDEDDDWLDDICEKKDQEVQNLLIDDLFGKN